MSSLIEAAGDGDLQSVKRFIQIQGEDVNQRNKFGNTALHFAVSRSGDLQVINFLIRNGADINSRNAKGWTPLHLGASTGKLNCVKLLIDNGADVNIKDSRGRIALHLAKQEEIRAFLHEKIKTSTGNLEQQRTLQDSKISLGLPNNVIEDNIRRAIKEHKRVPYARSKLMVLGEEKAGKTSTIKSLLKLPFIENEEKTIGAQIHTIDAKKWDTDNPKEDFANIEQSRKAGDKSDVQTQVKLTIWDYAGKEILYSMHHLFLTKYGIYLIVFSMEDMLNTSTRVKAIQKLQIWLNSLKLHAEKAPLILVGTHLDKCQEENKELVNRIIKEELEFLNDLGLVRNINGKLLYFPIDNKNKKGTEDLREVITATAAEAEYAKELVPLSWLRCLGMMLRSEKDFLVTTNVRDFMCKSCGLQQKEFYKMLEFFDTRGMITYFSHPKALRDIIVLNPQWLISGISAVLLDQYKDRNLQQDQEDKSISEASLSAEMLDSIWSSYSKISRDFFRDVMQNMLLLCSYEDKENKTKHYVIPNFSSNTEQSTGNQTNRKTNYTGRFFALDFSGEYMKATEKKNLVCYLPFGVFERLVCLCIKHSTTYNGSMFPVVKANYAKLSFGVNAIFELEKINKMILVRTKEGTCCVQLNELVKILYSMMEELKGEYIGNRLAMSLLLPSEEGVYAEYTGLVNMRKNAEQSFFPNRKRSITALVSSYDFWFENDDQNLINPELEETMLNFFHYLNNAGHDQPTAPHLETTAVRNFMKSNSERDFEKLSSNFKYHFFISYKQSSAIDVVGTFYMCLLNNGYKCWYDQQLRDGHQITKEAMEDGIKDSLCYILFLSQDIFKSAFVLHELRTAVKLKKKILFVHHPDTGTPNHSSFGHYIEAAPNELKYLFDENESIPFRRRFYEQVGMMQEIRRRIK